MTLPLSCGCNAALRVDALASAMAATAAAADVPSR